MRRMFGKWILKKAREDNTVILIVGDIGYGIFDKFREEFPDRFINIGICEQSMVSIAAGLALQGLKPYIYTITPFLIERPYEQIKVDIVCNNANVKLIGYDDYPKQGPTHCCATNPCEFLKSLCIDVYSPKNSEQTKKFLNEIYDKNGPAFMHLRKDNGR